LALVWKAGYKISVSPESIVSERKIITIAWKWHGKREVFASNWDRNQDDKAMLKDFIPILNSADEAVAHFGDSFDLPWIKGRCLFHGIKTFPKYKTIDTKQWSSRYFLLNSNKLDYLARYLGIGCKLHTDYDLWKRIVLDKDPIALRYMVKYNKGDVRLLEQVYDRLQEAVPHHTHAGVLNGKEKYTCPKCGSGNVKTSKTTVSAKGVRQFQMQCRCGTYYSISESVHDKYLEKKK
jgi:predicted PolB exonuclease-like 3'-5' exonuclease